MPEPPASTIPFICSVVFTGVVMMGLFIRRARSVFGVWSGGYGAKVCQSCQVIGVRPAVDGFIRASMQEKAP